MFLSELLSVAALHAAVKIRVTQVAASSEDVKVSAVIEPFGTPVSIVSNWENLDPDLAAMCVALVDAFTTKLNSKLTVG